MLQLGELLEVLGEPVSAAELIGPSGAIFLVGEGADAASILAARADWRPETEPARLNTVLDVSRLGELDRASLGDRLIEPALDGKGPIFLDASGVTAGALRQGRPGTHLVELDAERRVTAAREVRPL